MAVSMSATWDEARAFIVRERRLLVPLALATLFAGAVVFDLAGPETPNGRTTLLATLALLGGALLSSVGQLAISALVLRPGASVREALQLGVARLPRLVLIFFLLGLLLAIPVLLFGLAAMKAGYDPTNPATAQNLPSSLALVALLGMAALIWLAVRLVLVTPLLADRPEGPVTALRDAFARTRGLFWKLFAVFILYAVLALVVGSAVTYVLGGLIMLLARALGSPFTGQVLLALTSGLVTAALALVATVFLATLYRRTSSGT